VRGKTKVFIGAFVIVFILIFSGRLLFGFINKDGVSGVSADSWPMFRHDLVHSGSSNTAAPRTNETLWKFNTGGQVGSPTVVNGVVYVGSYDRRIYAFRANDGVQVWNSPQMA
jgi:eukaryotic-like serine/threonine-protein kinase